LFFFARVSLLSLLFRVEICVFRVQKIFLFVCQMANDVIFCTIIQKIAQKLLAHKQQQQQKRIDSF